MTVEGPNDLAGEPATGSCGSALVVEVPVATPPVAATAQGGTAAEARENLPAFDNATAAVGEWTVRVTGSRGGTPLPGLPGPGTPGGSIVMSIERWEPELSPVQR